MTSTRTGRRGAALRWRIGAATLATAMAVTGAHAETAAERTFTDSNGDRLLEIGAGEAHVARQDLAKAGATRAANRRRFLTFTQFTDTHVVDEESPLRLEFLDAVGAPLTSAYRPQEGLSAQVVNEMVRQVRKSSSPVTGSRSELVMTTGDNSDNSQLNEVRDFIDVMDGGAPVDPDSGVAGTCGLSGKRRFDGVRGSSTYYEPDGSGPGQDGRGYAPTAAANLAAIQRSNRVRDFRGLFDAMNAPFPTVGLTVPWYGIFGNHDGLIQGNQPRNAALDALAVGCVKVLALSPTALTSLQGLLAGGLTPAEFGTISAIVTRDLAATAADPTKIGTLAKIVPSDPARRPLKKSEYIQQHFTTRGRPVGHGFTAANVASGMGNFSFAPKPGLRFIVLDSMNETGYADGNIDDTQFRWLHLELVKAEARREVVMAFAHHSLRTMNQPGIQPAPVSDLGGDASPLVHLGLGPNGGTAACATTDPDAAPPRTETVRCLFLRHRSVVAFVSGHEHLNRIVPYARAAAKTGGFWEITTASHIDWPQQSRLFDVADNRDGTLSLFATMLDHSDVARTDVTPAVPVSVLGVKQLAAISRELSFNDPQADNGLEARSNARGTAADRNVELLLINPYPAP